MYLPSISSCELARYLVVQEEYPQQPDPDPEPDQDKSPEPLPDDEPFTRGPKPNRLMPQGPQTRGRSIRTN